MCGNFQILVVSAVKICEKQRLKNYPDPLPGHRPWAQDPMNYGPQMKIPGAVWQPKPTSKNVVI